MNYQTLAAHLSKFITQQEEIASLWDGKTPGAIEDNTHTASNLIELAQPLLDQLKTLIANEDFTPPAK
jgi:protein-arginine kinase activator protein McsA